MRSVGEELTSGCANDEFCIGAMQGAVESYVEGENPQILLRAFLNAAKARKTNIDEVLKLVESDPEKRVTSMKEWEAARKSLLEEYAKGGVKEPKIVHR